MNPLMFVPQTNLPSTIQSNNQQTTNDIANSNPLNDSNNDANNTKNLETNNNDNTANQ